MDEFLEDFSGKGGIGSVASLSARRGEATQSDVSAGLDDDFVVAMSTGRGSWRHRPHLHQLGLPVDLDDLQGFEEIGEFRRELIGDGLENVGCCAGEPLAGDGQLGALAADSIDDRKLCRDLAMAERD